MKETISKALDVLILTINYVVINYALYNIGRILAPSLLQILFGASDIWLTIKYWEDTDRIIGNKIISRIIWSVSLILLVAFTWFVGFADGAVVPFQ